MVSRSKFYDVKDVNVHELQLDSYNPRIRHGIDQRDCIDRIVKDRDTFMRLLRDISSHGLSPEHILISRNEDGKWIVRDGNRRVTALKLLTRPEASLPDQQLHSILQRIIKDMPIPIEETINCLACDDEATILDYVRRKHTGENLGAGQVGWSALLISLFNVHVGAPDQNRRAAQVILWAEEHGLSVENDFPITTLTRALNNETLRLLGLEVIDDELSGILPENQIYALVARVINDMASGRVNVKRDGDPGSIYSPEDANAYFRRVREETGPSIEQPAQPGGAQPQDSGSNANNQSNNGTTSSPNLDGEKTDAGATGARPPATPIKPAWERPCLFGRRKNSAPGFSVPSGESKAITIVAELRRLNPMDTPLAVTMLLRALIERSEIHYRQKHGLKNKGTLHQNVAASADHMKNNDFLTGKEHDVVVRHTRSDAGMLHIKTLQACIHEAEFHPNGQNLNTTWDEIGCFVKACWG